MNNETKNCQNCKKDFVIDADDFGFYEKINVPAPTFCPGCRSQRRLVWRNNMSLYSGKCKLCDKSVVTLYAPDSGITIYCNKCWWSDKWDPKSYGMDYDFSRPFFEQYNELIKKIPHIAIVNDEGIASVNCEYTHDWWFSKNCYMAFSGWYVENVMYSFFITAGKDIMDSMLNMAETSFIYECINCTHAYRLTHSFFSRACIESHFLYDCHNCTHCFMCTGLRNKQYHFKNKEYSKEEYEKIIKSYELDTVDGLDRAQKEFDEFKLSYPRRFAWLKKNTNCNGDIVSYCKNTKDSFIAKECENCRYGDFISSDKDSYDITMTGEMSECYEGVVVDHSQKNFFGVFSVKSQDIRYTEHCHSSKHLFGCASLRNNSYCIFNKQYTKEEYEELVPKIIKHMNNMPYVDKNGILYKYGEFFPIELSPFGYNETAAQVYFPENREDVVSKGYSWQDNTQRTFGKETLTAENIPKTITETPDDITNEILACVSCKRNYKIIPQELVFYRKMNLPVPHKCFYCRHSARIARCNPFKLWHRTCMCEDLSHGHPSAGSGQANGKCDNEFETSYSPNRPEIVYCEKCYQQEIL